MCLLPASFSEYIAQPFVKCTSFSTRFSNSMTCLSWHLRIIATVENLLAKEPNKSFYAFCQHEITNNYKIYAGTKTTHQKFKQTESFLRIYKTSFVGLRTGVNFKSSNNKFHLFNISWKMNDFYFTFLVTYVKKVSVGWALFIWKTFGLHSRPSLF